MPSRALQGVLYHPINAVPWANGMVRARLLQLFLGASDSLLVRGVEAFADADGNVALDLPVPAYGEALYSIVLPDGSNRSLPIAYADTPLDIMTIFGAQGSDAVVRRRTIYGTIYRSGGQVWGRAPITWSLDKPFATFSAVYPRETFTIHTSANGAFTTDLAVPDRGVAYYTVLLPDTTRVSFTLDVGEPIPIQDLLLGAGIGAGGESSIQTLIDSRIERHAAIVATPEQLGHVRSGPDVVVGSSGLLRAASDSGTLFGDAYYRHVQQTPSTEWTIVHGLGKRPTITISDDTGEEVVGDIDYVDDNTVILRFSAAISGEAICN